VAEYFKDFVAPAVAAVVTLVIREGFPKLWRPYQARYIDPRKAHQRIFLDQVNWYEDRAAKLAVFHFQLVQEPPPDAVESEKKCEVSVGQPLDIFCIALHGEMLVPAGFEFLL